MELTTSVTSATDTDDRVLSVDFLRGVVMFFLIAEATGLYDLLDRPALKDTFISAIGLQFSHHPWNGLRAWDLGQPFFMFISGVAMYFSYNRRWKGGEPWGATFAHALRRSLLLLILGWAIYLIVPMEGHSSRAFLYDVLPELAAASLVAFLILRRPVIQQITLAFALIGVSEVLYRLWAALGQTQPFIAGQNFGSFVDRLFMGGASAEHWAVFNIVPSTAFVIWGTLAGRLLRQRTSEFTKIGRMSAIGLGGVSLGFALSTFTPIIRRICTSSFVVLSGGLSLLALALAFWLIDVLRVRKGATFLVAVGMNPIFLYLVSMSGGADWLKKIVAPFSQGLFGWVGENAAGFAAVLATLALLLGLCYWFCRRKIFIKI